MAQVTGYNQPVSPRFVQRDKQPEFCDPRNAGLKNRANTLFQITGNIAVFCIAFGTGSAAFRV